MKRFWFTSSLLIGGWLTISVFAAEKPMVVNVWPGGKAPGDNSAKIPKEHQRFDMKNKDGTPYSIGGQPVKWITSVTKPTLTFYRPDPKKDHGGAVIVCPGGGYWNLAIDLEGEEIAKWLTTLGCTGIVLKYRVPRRPGRDEKRPSPEALEDAQRAVRLVRARSKQYGIDPDRIGMIGFSVGGNVVAVTSTTFDQLRYPRLDSIDDISSRPDLGICCYSGYLKATDKDGLDLSVNATKDAPPLFLVHASDDTEADAEHSLFGYLALKRAGADVELHLFQAGEHGFGVRAREEPVTRWIETCADWMRFRGFMTPQEKTSGQREK
jgi:acetyl esterase/lipase